MKHKGRPVPEQAIKKMYEEEPAATPEEAKQTTIDLLQDPEMCCDLVMVLWTMRDDPDFEELLRRSLKIEPRAWLRPAVFTHHQRMQRSPSYALDVGRSIIFQAERMKPGYLQGIGVHLQHLRRGS